MASQSGAIRLTTCFALGLALASGIAPAWAQSCDCQHQGHAVDCPAGLPAGSRSVQFVSGGTQWTTPTGQIVFVPQATFSCRAPASTQGQASISPNDHHGDHNQAQQLLLLLGQQAKHHHHDDHQTELAEDPAIACYRKTRAAVRDSGGVVHSDTLYGQLCQAEGFEPTHLPATGTTASAGHDCGGNFYQRDGVAARVPTFPGAGASAADVDAWRARVRDFYSGASRSPNGGPLAPGQAALCQSWAEAFYQPSPDHGLVQTLETLQRAGAEQGLAQDTPWINGIVAAGTAQGCPHPFTAPGASGNHVNDKHLLDAADCGAAATWFIGDATGDAGMDVYRSQERAPAGDGPSCKTQIRQCMDACQASNVDQANACIQQRGSPTGGECQVNEAGCSCRLVPVDCRK